MLENCLPSKTGLPAAARRCEACFRSFNVGQQPLIDLSQIGVPLRAARETVPIGRDRSHVSA